MIGVVAHFAKPGAGALVRQLCGELTARGMDFLVDPETASHAAIQAPPSTADFFKSCKLVVVMGGDGTILRFVHRMGEQIRPVFGINLGTLGFLTCLGPSEIARATDAIQREDFTLSRRHLFQVEHLRNMEVVRVCYALNDVVISRGERSQLVRIEVRVDGDALTNYNADGLILATPTGSTAYSLSAGGPILMPDSGAAVITPICPHVLTNRSTVVSDRSLIEVLPSDPDQHVFYNVDGQESSEIQIGDCLRVSKSERVLPLAMLPERPFTDVLRQKLKWTGSNI
jgi:NAD+ kinase